MRKLRLNPAFLLGVLIFFLWGCASIGNPSGGPRDEDPPRFVRANPAPGTVNFDGSRIRIYFDELVNVKDAFTKVVISPPSAKTPRVSSQGRHVDVQFSDTLLPNTTYTIDFADAIEDNNEGNKLEGFTYSFSTGESIDTLRISGMVLGAKDLEPQQGVLVGVHSNLNDSAFVKTRFDRVAKTDDRGRFTIRGLKPGTYRVFALNDLDGDMRYANPEENLAFYQDLVVPETTRIEVQDTTFNLLTGEVDTITTRTRTRYLPYDVLLRSFNSEKKQQFLAKYERQDSTKVVLQFNAKGHPMPGLSIVGHEKDSPALIVEKTQGNDSLTYWLPKHLVGVDSLRIATTYLRPDSTGNLVSGTDTLQFITKKAPKAKKPKVDKKKKKMSAADSIAAAKPIPLNLTVGASATHDVYKPVTVEFSEPPLRVDSSMFRLEVKKDTLWVPYGGMIAVHRADTLSPRKYVVDFDRSFDTEYRLLADTLAFESIYGKFSDPLSSTFRTKPQSDYTSLTFRMAGIPDSVPAYVDLLTSGDGVVRSVPVTDGTAFIPFLDAGTYYARVVFDINGNGRYDTGNFEEGLQPEYSYYYPKSLNLKKNFDRSEEWNVFATAIDLQKPEKIKKNKPQRKAGEKQPTEEYDEEDEEFDPTRNPFDPNDRGRNGRGRNGRNNSRNPSGRGQQTTVTNRY